MQHVRWIADRVIMCKVNLWCHELVFLKLSGIQNLFSIKVVYSTYNASAQNIHNCMRVSVTFRTLKMKV